jgi:hypothetical protein
VCVCALVCLVFLLPRSHDLLKAVYSPSLPCPPLFVSQVCRQLELQFDTSARSQTLWDAMGLAQHHDAVSGTEKQHVANDYARHLSEGSAECKAVIDEGLNRLLGGALPLSECPFLNQSDCPATASGACVCL